LTIAALAALLAASMLAVGTTVTVVEFRALLGRPVMLLLAVLANVVVVPAIAVVATRLVGMDSAATLGVVLAAAAPGGGTGALLTMHARGDLATSAALQGVLAPLGLLSVPIWAAVAGQDVVPPGAGGALLIAGALLGQLVPLGVGMLLRRRQTVAAARVHRVSRRVADLLLAGLVAYFVVTGVTSLPDLGWLTMGVIATVVLSSLAVVFVPGLGSPQARRAVAMTTTVRNLSLALFVGSSADPVAVLVLLSYGLVMYGFSVPAAMLLARANSRPASLER
jgi:BASS family bile acid:Na+ symporter